VSLKRLLGQVVVVMEAAMSSYARLGFTNGIRAPRHNWGIEATMYMLEEGSYFELVAPIDAAKSVGATITNFIDTHGEGLYLTAIEVDDVEAEHARLVSAGVPVLGPPEQAPAVGGWDCKLLWIKPRASAGAFIQFLGYGSPPAAPVEPAPIRRLFNEAIAVRDLEAAIGDFERLGFVLWNRSGRADWGLDTATFRLEGGSSIELVMPTDGSRPVASIVADRLEKRGQGHYMSVMEVADARATARRLEAAGVPILGPDQAPPESPWGPVQQMWVRPSAAHGAFLEFLSL
jgi:catechol 2,3-dioxygenase-like lactoylglutathione lyase family enzyme